MEQLLVSFRVVAPLVLYMAVGVLLKRLRTVDDAGFRGINRILFYVTIPSLCYLSVAAADLRAMVETPFLLYVGLGLTLVFLLSMLIVPRFCKDNARRGVLVLGIFRPNEGIFGLSIAAALLGAAHMGYMTLAVSLSVPLTNALSVYAMERYRGGRANLGRMLVQIFTNPILIGCLLGFAANLIQLRLPTVLNTTLTGIAGITTPLAFITLGGTLSFGSLRKNRVSLAVVTLLRLVVIPLVFVLLFAWLGFPKDAVASVLIVFGAPTATVIYNMAANLGADEDLAASIVAITSVLSIVTMFLFLFTLGTLGII